MAMSQIPPGPLPGQPQPNHQQPGQIPVRITGHQQLAEQHHRNHNVRKKALWNDESRLAMWMFFSTKMRISHRVRDCLLQHTSENLNLNLTPLILNTHSNDKPLHLCLCPLSSLYCISVFENFLKVVDNLSLNLGYLLSLEVFFSQGFFSKCLICKFGLKNEVDNSY